MNTRTLIAILFAFLALAGLMAWWVWSELGDVAMSGHGYTALILGVVFSFGLGAGLMFLVFYSSRRGYDDGDQ
tara:strand:+ start:364 stop:582 length:219 start_codon:yes stop_codon:yes gene_type:complete